MKKSLIYILMIAVVILTACGGGQSTATEAPAETEPPAATEAPATEAPGDTEEPGATEAPAGGEGGERCGDQSQLAEEIFLYTWVEYMDPEILTQFEEECGVK
ncbi:MAG TPA: hypothetical protein VFY83_02325, partial [Anaerolineales bacterium]|nr:hypothetical protein [Anaerolineales bacterium]